MTQSKDRPQQPEIQAPEGLSPEDQEEWQRQYDLGLEQGRTPEQAAAEATVNAQPPTET